MIYAEAAYFDGNHCQHVADWLDARRRKRAETDMRDMRRRQTRDHR